MRLTTQLTISSAVAILGAMILDGGLCYWTGATIFTIGCLLWVGVVANHFSDL